MAPRNRYAVLLTAAELEEYQNTFATYDADGGGDLEVKEIRSPPRTPRTPRDAPPTTPSIDILRLGIAPGSPPLTDLRSTAAVLDRQLLAVGALSIES